MKAFKGDIEKVERVFFKIEEKESKKNIRKKQLRQLRKDKNKLIKRAIAFN